MTGPTSTPTFARLPIDDEQRDRAIRAALTRVEAYDLTGGVFDRVERYAAESPDRPAVVHGDAADAAVTYRQLAGNVRRTATGLREAGVQAGDVVAVGGERGVHVITAFLALELLGAIYLPVDPGWPAVRVQHVLADSGAVLLVTTGAVSDDGSLAKGATAADCRALHLPYGDRRLEGARLIEPNEVRYLLYTSGSTGRPKGALVEQRGMLNHLWAKVQDLAMTADDRLAQTAPLGFDVSVWQMLAALLVGGTVHVYPDDAVEDAALLLETLRRLGTTVIELVPTIIRFLLDAVDAPSTDRLSALRWMIATGEELPPALAARWLRSHPNVALMNAYGPTECSDDVTHASLGIPDEASHHLPIGGPIGNVTLYVLRRDGDDGRWLACEHGEPGELFVGGVAVGRGYIGDPERTAAAFFADPFTVFEEPPFTAVAGRLYRTGDAVRVLPTGELEYLGRVDRQVKLGGVRMELAEIEAVLAAHPAVAAAAAVVVKPKPQAALVARESALATETSKPPRLVAYVSLAPNAEHTREELLGYLAARLPRPMVPSTVVELPELPLTRNGKIDYVALPAPPSRERPAHLHYEAPVGARESAVAAIVAEVLGTDGVGRHDRFVELGGDSLLAMRLVATLRRAGFQATLRDVLSDGSPATLARVSSGLFELNRGLVGGCRLARRCASADPAPPAPVKFEEGSSEDATSDAVQLNTNASPTGPRTRPLTPEQAGVYFHWRLDPESPNYSYQGSLLIDGPLDHAQLARAWQLLLVENPLLLARFAERDGVPEHTYPYWDLALPAAEELPGAAGNARAEHYRALATTEAAHPFDLHGEPGVRLRLFRLAENEHRLLVTMHEVLLDGWGATVLFERLAELYTDAADPVAEPNPQHAARYDRYLDWHAERLAAPEVAEAGKYWQQQLIGELPVLDIAQSPRPSRPDYRGGIVEAVLDAAATAELRAAAGGIGSTAFAYLLAAYALALTYYGDADEVVIGAPMANRERPEQADVPAFLLSMLPLRITVPADAALAAFATQVRDLVLDGLAAADHPFGWTLHTLSRAARSGASTPVFQTMLNMLAYPARQVQADGLSFRFVELDTGFTKYDCALYVQPHGSDGLLVQFAYQVRLMEADAARRVLHSTLRALDALVRHPETAIRDLDLLPDPVPLNPVLAYYPLPTGGTS